MAKSLPRPESLLATLPTEFSHRLFAKARPLSLAASRTLFVAGDDGDGCYRVEEGLLKASVSVATGGERILAILGPGSVVGELSMIGQCTALGFGHCAARFEAELCRPRHIRGIRAINAGTLPSHYHLARATAA